MSINLKRLELQKLHLGITKLANAGIDVERWLAMVDADHEAMQSLVAAWPFYSQLFRYDATAILGFGEPSKYPLPKAKNGEIVIRYGGWSLQDLRNHPFLCERNVMLSDSDDKHWHGHIDWYDDYPWSTQKLDAGIYRLRIPVPDSADKTFAQQLALLPPGEEAAPVVLVATALLSHRIQTGEILFLGHDFHCKEQTNDGSRVSIGFDENADDKLCVEHDTFMGSERYSDVDLWLASIRIS